MRFAKKKEMGNAATAHTAVTRGGARVRAAKRNVDRLICCISENPDSNQGPIELQSIALPLSYSRNPCFEVTNLDYLKKLAEKGT